MDMLLHDQLPFTIFWLVNLKFLLTLGIPEIQGGINSKDLTSYEFSFEVLILQDLMCISDGLIFVQDIVAHAKMPHTVSHKILSNLTESRFTLLYYEFCEP